MAGGGGAVSPAQQPGRGGRRGHRQKAAYLPLDIIILEIATRSDPATLVRCAATCRDARRRIVEDPDFHGRLRLRDTDRFVLPLLRGHMTRTTSPYTCSSRDRENDGVYMVDTTGAADATRLVKITFAGADQTQKNNDVMPVDSRGGLVLVRHQRQLLVCNPATRRRMVLPPEPAFTDAVWDTGVLVLLVGDRDDEGGDGTAAVVGRHFHVLKAKLKLSQYRAHRRLLVHTFSSKHGAWSPLTEIPTPDLHGTDYEYKKPLVVGDLVHWLYMTNSGDYMLILHVGTARVNVTSLPASFSSSTNTNNNHYKRRRCLLATASAGGNPIVLVANTDNISAWEQSKHTRIWKPQPHVVIENETILQWDDGLAEVVERERRWRKHVPALLWFGERSGVVLLRIDGSYLLWLDLHSKKIVRCFSDRRLSYAHQVYCPYEVDLSSWVPTFGSSITL